MNANSIAQYLSTYVPTFQGIEVLGPGVAYHYTINAKAIETDGKFLGAPLNPNLDQTQNPNQPNIATSNPGVVFAYEELEVAAEEGDCTRLIYSGVEPEIFEVHYAAAVRAAHVQEALLDAPPTILISSAEIIFFKRLGACAEHYDEDTY